MKQSYKILIVEDNPSDVELICRQLKREDMIADMKVVETVEEYIEELGNFCPDIVLSDYSLPRFDGMSALKIRNEKKPDLPFILVTGSINEEVAVQCMRTGADDYILKDNLVRLCEAVRSSIKKKGILRQKEKAEQLLRESEQKYRTMVDLLPDAIIIHSEGKLLFANRAAVKLTGAENFDEIREMPVMSFVHPDSVDNVKERIKLIYESDKPSDYTEEKLMSLNKVTIEAEVIGIPVNFMGRKAIQTIVRDITERKKAEATIRRSEREFQNYFESGSTGMSVTASDTKFIQVNEKLCQMLGYTKEELLKMTWIDLTFPDDVEQNTELFNKALNGEIHKYQIDKRFVKKNGEKIYVTLATVAQRNDDGTVHHFLSTYLDITDKKIYEERIEQERIMLRTLIDNIPDSIYIMDSKGRKVISNKSDVELIGASDETEVIGKTDIDLYPGDIGIRCHNDNMTVINNGEAIINREELFMINGGNFKWLLTTKVPLFGKTGNVNGLVGIGYDITSLKLVEDELKKSQAQLSNALRMAHLGAWEYDVKNDIFIFNDLFYAIFRTTAEREGGYEMSSEEYARRFVHPADADMVGVEVRMAIESEDPEFNRQVEHRFLYSNGETGYISVRFFIVKDEAGRTIKTYGVNQDITERKKVEVELVKAKEKAEESDRLKTAFLHNISHEIRTPMNAIVGFAALLSEPDADEETKHSYIEMIMSSSNHLLSIINDIIDISNIEARIVRIHKQDVLINTLLGTLQNQYSQKSKEKNIDLFLETDLTDEESVIITDPTKLQQIISNILNNAFKFTSKGEIRFGYKVKNETIEFFTSDTGIGISSEDQSRIFERFFQVEDPNTKLFEGTGLGLAISKAYVELLGGEMRVNSNPGKGSTFYFTVPFEKPVCSDVSQPAEITAAKFTFHKKRKILIAEDIDSNFKLVSYFLKDTNAEVVRAVNGKEAVDKCLHHGDFDLVLMDIKMPEMDGFTATKKIIESFPDLPIIAQTAYIDDRELAEESGCAGFLAKPFDRKTLLNTIIRFIS